jgi:hypothetical protein
MHVIQRSKLMFYHKTTLGAFQTTFHSSLSGDQTFTFISMNNILSGPHLEVFMGSDISRSEWIKK